MKHRLGNTPKCWSCLWYREKEEARETPFDGYCTNKKQLSRGINGRKLEHPPERSGVLMTRHACKDWQDAEQPDITHFDVVTGGWNRRGGRPPEPETMAEPELPGQISLFD